MGGGLEFSWFGAQSSRRFGARKLHLVRVAPAASAAVSLQKQDVSLRFASAEGVVVPARMSAQKLELLRAPAPS